MQKQETPSNFGEKSQAGGAANPHFPQNTYNSTDSSGYNSSSTIDALEHAKNLSQTAEHARHQLQKSDTLNSNSSGVSRAESMVNTDRRCSMGGHVPASEFVPYKVSVSQPQNFVKKPLVPRSTESLSGYDKKANNNVTWQIRRPSEEIAEIEQSTDRQGLDIVTSNMQDLSLGQPQMSFKIIPNPHISSSPNKNIFRGTAPIPAPRAIKYPPALPPKQNRKHPEDARRQQQQRPSPNPELLCVPDLGRRGGSPAAKSRHGSASSQEASPIRGTPTGRRRVLANVTVERSPDENECTQLSYNGEFSSFYRVKILLGLCFLVSGPMKILMFLFQAQ